MYQDKLRLLKEQVRDESVQLKGTYHVLYSGDELTVQIAGDWFVVAAFCRDSSVHFSAARYLHYKIHFRYRFYHFKQSKTNGDSRINLVSDWNVGKEMI